MDLRLKYDAMGIPTKYKGRLVVLGDQEWGDTLRDVFAPTVNTKTINILLAIAAHQGLHLYGLDIFGAFITADIDAPVYVQLPKGLDPEHPDDQPIWRLRRTLYGLKRAPRAFYAVVGISDDQRVHTLCQRQLCLLSPSARWEVHILLHSCG